MMRATAIRSLQSSMTCVVLALARQWQQQKVCKSAEVKSALCDDDGALASRRWEQASKQAIVPGDRVGGRFSGVVHTHPWT